MQAGIQAALLGGEDPPILERSVMQHSIASSVRVLVVQQASGSSWGEDACDHR